MKYTEILRMNRELEKTLSGEAYSVAILGNIVVAQLKDILEYSLRTEAIKVQTNLGDYDNIVQDSLRYRDHRLLIIFWELANTIDGGQYRICSMSPNEILSLQTRIKGEIDLVLTNTQGTSLVLMNRFSALVFDRATVGESNLSRLSDSLNRFVSDNRPPNVRLVDIEKVIATVSIEKSTDFRYYYSSRAMYTIDFYKEYVRHILPFILAANGRSKKALILDCDNTLWKGILGEDGADGIEMSPETKSGAIFREVQTTIRELGKKGVILGLCSKNNPVEVEDVLRHHADMVLLYTDFVSMKVNWEDKVSNLKAIARELNIGTDSLVFVDDSEFEVDYVKKYLPEVTVVKVPEALHEYPGIIRDVATLFYNLSETKEDSDRNQMYREHHIRENSRKSFGDMTDYLESLGLRIVVYIDDKSRISRISQMTQKTNQFNLTTKRYTEIDLEGFVKNADSRVFAFEASDKFGDYGTTGLCIVTMDSRETAAIDILLMSCRVIGRNIEFAFFDFIADHLKEMGVDTVTATYIRTLKNDQVSDFYEKLGFDVIADSPGKKSYRCDLTGYEHHSIHFVEVQCG